MKNPKEEPKQEEDLILKLNKQDAQHLLSCLIRTSAKGKDLDVSQIIEEKIVAYLNS